MSGSQWPLSYTEARQAFLEAVTNCGARVESRLHSAKGPALEDLCLDIARVGKAQPRKALVILSGTHGVEGYCGSVCQRVLLTRAIPSIPETAIFLLHAVNPFGFAYNSRVNEDNVDLNRNFLDFGLGDLPKNDKYAALEPLLNPRSLDEKSIEKLDSELEGWLITPQRLSEFKTEVLRGQYQFPKGIFFGGTRPAWSNIAVREFVQSLPASIDLGIVLDIHTGLGNAGELEMSTDEIGMKYDRLTKWFPNRNVTNVGNSELLAYDITGGIELAFTQPGSDTPWHFVTLEFGTQPIKQVLLALQADNWLHCFGGTTHPLSKRVHAMMKDAFSVPSSTWQHQVVSTTLSVITEAINALQAYA
jgi:hypothetical protein